MTIKIGILSFAHMHAASYAAALAAHPDAAFVGIADPDPARGRKMATQFGTDFFDSDAALLDQNLDGMILTSENVHHRPIGGKGSRGGRQNDPL